MPQLVPLTIYRGDSGHWRFELWTDEALTVPYDLTGAVALAEVRTKSGATPVLADLACTVTPPNVVDVDLSPAVSGGLSGKAVWDLQLTFPGGEVRTVVAGPVTVTDDVTESTRAATQATRR